MQQEIKNHILGSKNYSGLCESTIDKLIDRETPKFKKKKDIEQSVRAKLHAWVNMFYINPDKLLKNVEITNNNEFWKELLNLHVSTKERVEFLEEFYSDIDKFIGNSHSILDLGCGFNPIAYFLYSKYSNIDYTAIDVEKNGIELLKNYFEKTNRKAKAEVIDILDFKSEKEYDMVFLFKILPLLEQQTKGFSKKLLKVLKTKYLCISFPTRSLSGKNVGMYTKYKKDIEELLKESDYSLVFEKEYKNEVLFVLQKIRY